MLKRKFVCEVKRPCKDRKLPAVLSREEVAKILLSLRRQYWSEYKPQKWLFEGVKPEKHISVRTAQKIFEHACNKVIRKRLPFTPYDIALPLIYLKEELT